MQTVRVGELVDEARLAHPGLGNERHNLTMTVAGELLDAAELLKFGIAADEPRQPASGDRLEPGPRRACPCHFVDIHRVGEPLHRHRAERLHGDEAFHHAPASTGVSRMLPGLASCSMRAARCVVRPMAV